MAPSVSPVAQSTGVITAVFVAQGVILARREPGMPVCESSVESTDSVPKDRIESDSSCFGLDHNAARIAIERHRDFCLPSFLVSQRYIPFR